MLHSAEKGVSDFRSRDRKFKSQLGHITFVEIGREIISRVILPTIAGSRRVVVRYWQKYLCKYWAQLFTANDVLS